MISQFTVSTRTFASSEAPLRTKELFSVLPREQLITICNDNCLLYGSVKFIIH